MNSLYQNLLRQNDNLTHLLDRAEVSPLSDQVASQITTSLANLERSLVDYAEFSKREVNTAKREKASLRSKKFGDDLQFMRDRWSRIQARGAQQQIYSDQRSDLFHRSAGAAAPTNGAVSVNIGLANAHDSAVDYYSQEQARLASTESHLDDFLAMGQNVLGNLVEQRHMLKRTHRRMLDAANSLGVSRSLISYIERRGGQDKWLFWGLVVVSIGLMWLMVKYLRG
ncbi:snare region anchored in the vesicle membrane C-terminus-domain-containing protein [Catenaria anguillulae PL171]|uniref:Protein transport protein BOS1 n=1 Tax=Catenaria anguillulae PL171 TaxID=765915 RepID=A0A1Y2HBK5_9FUNG|nr:snare region anchored in the vesicle membrane C-terminus-domain-containing protein [Catenaria anguillulae PL171]